MTYLLWTCSCGNTHISNSKRHHCLDSCEKCGDYVDFEDYGLRYGGNINEIYKSFKLIEMNFFDELAKGMVEQGIINPIKMDKTYYLDFCDVHLIRELEDEIIKTLI